MSIDRHDNIGGVWDERGNPRPESWNRNSIDPLPGFEEPDTSLPLTPDENCIYLEPTGSHETDPFVDSGLQLDGNDLNWESFDPKAHDLADHFPELYPWTFDEGRLRWWDVGCMALLFAAASAVLYIVVNLYLRYARGV